MSNKLPTLQLHSCTIRFKNLKYVLLTSILLLLFFLLIISQTFSAPGDITYSGNIHSPNGEPIEGVSVVVYDSTGSNIMGTATSDSQGNYSLTFQRSNIFGGTTAIRIFDSKCTNIVADNCTGDIPASTVHHITECVRIPNNPISTTNLCSKGQPSYEHCGVAPAQISFNKFDFTLSGGTACGQIDPEMERMGMQFQNNPKTDVTSINYGDAVNSGSPNCNSEFEVGNCSSNSYERCCETESIGNTRTIELTSDKSTKVIEHNENVLNTNWIDPNFDDSGWNNAQEIPANINWIICMQNGIPWMPSQNNLNLPSGCKNQGFMFLPTTTFPPILSTPDMNRPDLSRDFFRESFEIPENVKVDKAILFASSDNWAKFWVDGNPLVANQNNNLNTIDDSTCNSNPASGYLGGGLHSFDILPLLNLSNTKHVFAASVLNAKHCADPTHPMGLQYYLYIEYSENKDIGGNHCWIGGIDKTEAIPDPTDHTVNFWFEYTDTSQPTLQVSENKAFRHKFALVSSSNLSKLGKEQSLVFQNTLEENAEFIIDFSDLSSNTPSICLKTPKLVGNKEVDTNGCYVNNTNGLVSVLDAKRKLFSNNRILIDYKLQFNKDKGNSNLNFPLDKYTIYAIAEYETEDSWIADNYSTNIPEAIPASGQYSKKGIIGIDTIEPELKIPPPEITGYSDFNFNWSHNEMGQSGLHSFNNYCYSSQEPSFNINYNKYSYTNLSSNVTNNQDINRTLNINTNSTNYENCIGNPEKEIFTENGNLKSSYSFPTQNEYNYLRLNDLEVKIDNIMDYACNIADPQLIDPQAEEPWLTTKQGSVHSDSLSSQAIDVAVPPATNNGVEGYNLFFDRSSFQDPFWTETSTDLINISTNMLSATGGISNSNSSLTNQKLNNYNDNNISPLLNEATNNWYDYLKFLLNTKGINNEIKTIFTDRTVSSISQLDSNCADKCYFEFKENKNLTISSPSGKSFCDRKAIIFLKGNLLIEDDFINSSSENGCIFVVNGNTELKSKGSPKDKNPENANIKTSVYDIVEGFFIVAGNNSKFSTTKDIEISNSKIYADALLIKGGVVANEVTLNRNLGLRNIMQPAEFFMYDPRYIDLFSEVLSYSTLKIREK